MFDQQYQELEIDTPALRCVVCGVWLYIMMCSAMWFVQVVEVQGPEVQRVLQGPLVSTPCVT